MDKLPLLLRGQAYATSSRPVSLDFQTRVGTPVAAEDAADGVPCVLLLTRSSDSDADELSLRLAARGITQVRLDSDRCVGDEVTWLPGGMALRVRGRRYAPLVSWVRHFDLAGLPGTGEPHLDQYAREQWSAWRTAMRALRGTHTINGDQGTDELDRVRQLGAARAVGLAVPATVVTSRPAAALDALPPADRYVVKPLGSHFIEARPGELLGSFARRVSRDELAGATGVEPAPVIVQEHVLARRELRTFWVEGELVTFEVAKADAEALWTRPSEVDIRSAPTPRPLIEPLARLAKRWGLEVAAFDLLERDDGRYAFLEVNVDCDWLWFERKAGCGPVTRGVVDLVEQRFRERL